MGLYPKGLITGHLTFGVARNDIFFLKRYFKQSHTSLQYDVNNLGTKFLHLLLELLVDSLLIPSFFSLLMNLTIYS